MSRRNDPGYGSSEAPSFVRRDNDGEPTEIGWSKPTHAAKPEKYDYSYPDQRRPGYIVYILALVSGIFLCAWLRPMFIALVNAVG